MIIEKCPHCGLTTSVKEKKFVKITDVDAFRDLCQLLLRSSNVNDQKFKGALEDFPTTVARYGELTEKQSRFFAVIHKSVTGEWPPDLTTLKRVVVEPHKLPAEDDMPF